LQYVAILSLTALLVGGLLGDLILEVYGANYQVSRWFVGAFLLASVFGSMTAIIGGIIVASDRPWNWLVFTSIWFLVLCLLSLGLQNIEDAAQLVGAYLVLMAALQVTPTKGLI
jgi:O-antigen/teichoic acid export membrane protein